MRLLLVGGDVPGKLEAASEISGGRLRNYTEVPSGLSSRICHEHDRRPPPRPSSTRPKRADARRNYEKVLAAAREAFAEGGESTALEEIARRAGVGIGTLYRHFPNRQALLEALYVDEVEEVCRSAAEQLERRRPVGGAQRLVRALHRLHRAPSRRSPPSCSTTSTTTRSSSRPAARRCSKPASRCSSAPRRPASCARTSTSARSSRWSSGSPRSRPPIPSRREHILRIALDGLRYRPEA